MRLLTMPLSLLLCGLLGGQPAASWVEQGERAYQKTQYPEAVQDFERAISQDPSNVRGLLDLGSAYVIQWVPGEPSLANRETSSKARANFQLVLKLDPANKHALSSLANLSYYQPVPNPPDEALRAKQLAEARDLYRRLAQIDGTDKEAFYMQGVIAWADVFPAVQRAREESDCDPTNLFRSPTTPNDRNC